MSAAPSVPVAGANGTHVADDRRPVVAVLDGPSATGDLEHRILAATLRLVARWGVAKTTIADVAREADCSRATVYRAFPGGKGELFRRLGRTEFESFFAGLLEGVDRSASLEEALTDLLVDASDRLAHHEALQFVLAHEPGLVLPFLGFNQIDRLYAEIRRIVAPHLDPFLPDAADAAWAAEWSARVVLTYLFDAGRATDLSRRAVAGDIVRRFLLPALSPDRPVVPA